MRRRSLQADDIPTEVVKAGFNEYRQTLADLIRNRVDRYAGVIGLPSATPQFEQDLVDAVQWCHWMHLKVTSRKRIADIRKELLQVKREARDAKKSLTRLRDALNTLTPQCWELLDEQLESVAKTAVSLVAKQVPWFHALSLVADLAGLLAERLKDADKGGAPQMLGFQALVKGLARAFENAKSRSAKVTRNAYDGCFGGEFVTLVEAVLPLAKCWAETPERPLHYPKSPRARGKHIYDLTRRSAGKKKRTIPKTVPRKS